MLLRFLLLLLPITLIAACAYPDTNIVDQREIKRATVNYVKHLSDGDGRDAYSLLSPALKARCSESTFDSMVSLTFAPSQHEPDAKVQNIQIEGKTATARLVLSDEGSEDTLTYEYEKDGADWYVMPPDLNC